MHNYNKSMEVVTFVHLCMQVPLGVMHKCETSHEDMIDIMALLQQYVPMVHTTVEKMIPSTAEKIQVHNYINCCNVTNIDR